MKYYREYDFGHGVTVKPRQELDGVLRAMGDTEPCYVKVFDVFLNGTLKATAETWDQAKDMAFDLSMERHKRQSRLLYRDAVPSA